MAPVLVGCCCCLAGMAARRELSRHRPHNFTFHPSQGAASSLCRFAMLPICNLAVAHTTWMHALTTMLANREAGSREPALAAPAAAQTAASASWPVPHSSGAIPPVPAAVEHRPSEQLTEPATAKYEPQTWSYHTKCSDSSVWRLPLHGTSTCRTIRQWRHVRQGALTQYAI